MRRGEELTRSKRGEIVNKIQQDRSYQIEALNVPIAL